jgi:hypothetical protein
MPERVPWLIFALLFYQNGIWALLVFPEGIQGISKPKRLGNNSQIKDDAWLPYSLVKNPLFVAMPKHVSPSRSQLLVPASPVAQLVTFRAFRMAGAVLQPYPLSTPIQLYTLHPR